MSVTCEPGFVVERPKLNQHVTLEITRDDIDSKARANVYSNSIHANDFWTTELSNGVPFVEKFTEA